jgi:hypothetical protein
MREFGSQGFWYLPTKPKDIVAGTLTYSLRDGLLLSLTGTLADDLGRAPSPYPLIHGVVADNPYGRLVTLVDCFQRRSTLAIPGFASEEIRANRAYVGARYLFDEERSQFISVRATYSNLAEWSGLTGFRSFLAEPSSPGIISAQYQTPAPVELTLEDERQVRVEANASAAQGGRRFEINEQVDLTLSGIGHLSPLDTLRTLIFPFEDFLTFAADTPSPAQDIAFIAEATDDQVHKQSVHLLYQPVFQTREERRAPVSMDMLFTLAEMSSSHPDLLRTWLRFRKEFEAACDVYFGLQYATPAYLETKVLLLQIALGLFLVDRVRDGAIRDELASLTHAFSTLRDRTWLGILPTAEELSLPWGVFALIQDYREILVPALGDDAEQFVTNLVTARHDLFHNRYAPETRRSTQLRLLHLIERLGFLVKVRILECLGFSREEISGLLSRNERYLNLAAGRLPGKE